MLFIIITYISWRCFIRFWLLVRFKLPYAIVLIYDNGLIGHDQNGERIFPFFLFPRLALLSLIVRWRRWCWWWKNYKKKGNFRFSSKISFSLIVFYYYFSCTAFAISYSTIKGEATISFRAFLSYIAYFHYALGTRIKLMCENKRIMTIKFIDFSPFLL